MNQYIIILKENSTKNAPFLTENSFAPENDECSSKENARTSVKDDPAGVMLGIADAESKRDAILKTAKNLGFFGSNADKLAAYELARDVNKLSDDLSQAKTAIINSGYDPTTQLVRFIVSNDPIHITTLNDTRKKLCSHNRYAILEEAISYYFEHH